MQEFEYCYLCFFNNDYKIIKKIEVDSPFHNNFINLEKLKGQIRMEILKRKEQLKNLELFYKN